MTPATTTDLDLLRDLNQAYLDSVRTGDVERFRQLLADDFQASTPAGEILLAHADAVIARVRAAQADLAALDGNGTAALRVGATPDLLARLAADGIGCDVCPVSNVRLGLIPDVALHPAPQLIAAGVPVTLNADDQLWFSTSITDQYTLARQVWGLNDETLALVALSGTRAAGMSSSTRQEFVDAVDAWLQPNGD